MIAEEGIDPVDREQLRIYFEQGCKPSSKWGIGSEYENFIFDIDMKKPLGYEGPKSISKVFDLLIKNSAGHRYLRNQQLLVSRRKKQI